MTTLTVRDARARHQPRREHHPGHRKTLVGKLVTHLCVLVGVLLSLFPFYWLLVMSTSTTADIFGYPPKLTFGPHLGENVRNVLGNVDLLGALANTLLVAGPSALLVMLF